MNLNLFAPQRLHVAPMGRVKFSNGVGTGAPKFKNLVIIVEV